MLPVLVMHLQLAKIVRDGNLFVNPNAQDSPRQGDGNLSDAVCREKPLDVGRGTADGLADEQRRHKACGDDADIAGVSHLSHIILNGDANRLSSFRLIVGMFRACRFVICDIIDTINYLICDKLDHHHY